MLPLVTSPLLAARPGVRHGFTTRRGGVSVGPLASLNLARRPGERDEALLENWRRVVGDPGALALVHQVHGKRVIEVEAGRGPLEVVGEADALVSRTPGVVVAVRVADCVPVLLAGPGVVAAVHAGWRGTVAGIVGETVAAMSASGVSPSELVAAIGPAIGVCCYEVGPEVAGRVAERSPEAVDTSRPREHVDLRRANAVQLRAAGVGQVGIVGSCTRCDPDSFSHRRDPAAGRLAGFVGLV